jgi:hypothetical protein
MQGIQKFSASDFQAENLKKTFGVQTGTVKRNKRKYI